jgi:phosphatidylglycerophosphate synthase
MEPVSTPRPGRPASALRARKPGAGVPAYLRWVNRPLGGMVAVRAAAAGWGPDTLTWLSAACSAAGICVLVTAPAVGGSGILVAVLFAVGYVLDSADGQLARLSGRASARGEWLDHVLDSVRMPAVHLAVAVALALRHGVHPAWSLVPLAFSLVATGTFMAQILAEQLRRGASSSGAVTAARRHDARLQPREPSGRWRSLLLLPVDFAAVCWCFLVWGEAGLFLGVYLVLFVANTAYFGLVCLRKARLLAPVGSAP